MKNNIASFVMLLAGAAAVLCCIVKEIDLNHTLLIVFITLFIFMVIGFIVQRIILAMNKDAEERAKEEAEKRREEEAKQIALEQEEELRRIREASEQADETGIIDEEINDEVNDEAQE